MENVRLGLVHWLVLFVPVVDRITLVVAERCSVLPRPSCLLTKSLNFTLKFVHLAPLWSFLSHWH
jgi:hypothetical protein